MSTYTKRVKKLVETVTAFYSADRYGLHLPRGNAKTGSIPAFNLLPYVTCTFCARTTCAKEGCYAMRDCFRHGYDVEKNTTFKAWAENTVMAVAHVAELEEAINGWFAAHGKNQPRFFRIHSAGDFVTCEYARMWHRIAEAHPETKFLAFTKQWGVVRRVPFDDLDNFSLVLSGWPGAGLPEDLKAKYRVADCVEHDSVPPVGSLECAGHCEQCAMCWALKDIQKDVYFWKH